MFASWEAVARDLGVEIMAPDRPGWGSSDILGLDHAGFAAWLADVMDVLKIEHAPVIGVSCGAQWAIAAAAGLPDRISGLGVVGAMGQCDSREALSGMLAGNKLLLGLARVAPQLLTPVLEPVMRLARFNPSATIRRFAASSIEPDRVLLLHRPHRHAYQGAVEHLAPDCARAMARDHILPASQWSIDATRITQAATLWHGTRDVSVPRHHSKRLANWLPNARLNEIPGAGHLINLSHGRQIIEAVL